MPDQFDVQSKLFEIISNLSEYDSSEKIEELKKELKFLQEWDADNSITVVDFGMLITDGVASAPASVISYLFCFPRCITNAVMGISYNLRIVPVSTAFAGGSFRNSEFYNYAYFIGAYLRNANFADCVFTGADFTGADLANSLLINADLTDAKIHSANFCGVNLTGAVMPSYADTITEFKEVVGSGNWDKNTKWINGTNLT